MPSSINRRWVVSDATIAFGGDRITAGLPLYTVASRLFGERFGFIGISEQVEQGGIVSWLARNGSRKIGERHLKIELARGNARHLGVQVYGKDTDALDMLQEVWGELCQIEASLGFSVADLTAPRLVRDLGDIVLSTTALVELPFTFEEAFPSAGFLNDWVRENSPNTERREDVSYKFSIEVPALIGKRRVTQRISIEPRVNEAADTRVFFTTSPLGTDEHFRLLEAFCERVRGPHSDRGT